MIRLTFSDNTVLEAEDLKNHTWTQNYYKDLMSVIDSYKTSLVFTTELSNKIKQLGDELITAQVYNANNNLIFTGFLRKSFSFIKNQKNQPIEIEILSPATVLDVELSENINLVNNTVTEILEAIGEDIGFSLTCAITEVIGAFVAEKGENVLEIVRELLFEAGYSFGFTSSGVFEVYPLFNAPPTTIQNKFNGTNILNQINITRNELKNGGSQINWSSVKVYENALIYEETEGQDDNNSCNVEIDPHSYMYGSEDNADGIHYLEYKSSLGEVIAADNVTLDVAGTDIDLLTTEFENLGKKAKWVAYNTASVLTAKYTKFRIYGDAYIKSSINQTKTKKLNKKLKEYNYKYVSNSNTVESHALKLADYIRYSGYNITFQSKTDYTLGSFVEITDYGIGTHKGRIIQKTYNMSDVIAYVVESYDDFEPAELDATDCNRHSGQLVIGAKGDKGDQGESGIISLRSLEQGGTEGLLGQYQGNLYIYRDSAWRPIQNADYMGEYTSFPTATYYGQYFYAKTNLVDYKTIEINGDTIEIDGSTIEIGKIYPKDYVYIWGASGWQIIEDRSDYRYQSAAITKAPEYLGKLTHDPEGAVEKDFYLYIGETTLTRQQGLIYVKENNSWRAVNIESQEASSYYMTALSDMISDPVLSQQSGMGFFNVVFAKLLIAQKATIEELQTKIIKMSSGGVIKSEEFDGYIDEHGNIITYGEKGWAITSKGDSCFIKGHFAGSLDCDVFKIEQDYLYYKEWEYTTSQGEAFKTLVWDQKDLWNGIKTEDGEKFYNINEVFGEDKAVYCDGIKIVLLKAKSILRTSSEDYELFGYDIYNNEYRIFDRYSGGMIVDYVNELYVKFEEYVETNNATIIKMINIPTYDPGVKNYLWNDNGTVKISNGPLLTTVQRNG